MIDSLNDLSLRVKRLDDSRRVVLATVRPNEQNIPTASPSNSTAIELDKRRLGYVDICARMNAMAVADTPMVLYRPARRGNVSARTLAYLTGKSGVRRTKSNMQIAQQSEDFEIVDDHESIEIMENPNPYMRGSADLRFTNAYAREITGNSYTAWVYGERALYPLSPMYMRVRPDEQDGRIVGSYIYGRDTAQAMEFQPDEIIHGMLFPDYSQPYYGVSWLHGIVTTADLWIATETYLKNLMQAEGRPSVLINLEGVSGDEQFQHIRRSLLERLKSALRRGNTIEVTGSHEGKPSVLQLGHNPKDMTSIEIGNDAERTIGNAAGIPEPMYQMSSSNVASAEAAERHWWRATIMPRACREAEEWTAWLHDNWEGTDDWFFAPENMVPEDRSADEQSAISAWNSGLVRRNEARVVLMYDPLEGDEGEQFIEQTRTQPPAAPSPFAGLFNLSQQPESVKAHDLGDESDHTPKIDTTPKPVDPIDKPCSCGSCNTPKAVKAEPWLSSKVWTAYKRAQTPDDDAGLSASDEAVQRLTEAYSGVFEQMRDAIIAASNAAPMGLKSASPRRYRTKASVEAVLAQWGITDIDQWSAEMLNATREMIEAEYYVQAGAEIERLRATAPERLAERVPTGDPRDIIIQSDRAAIEASKFADRYARDMDEVIRTIATDLADNISEGLEKGESLRQIQDRILNLYDAESVGGGTMSRARAERIARTEVAQASVDARIAGMAGSNIVQGFQFVKAVQACPVCDAVEAETRGKVYGIGEVMYPKGSSITGTDGRTYKFDYQDTIVPLHPNCRCGVDSVLVDFDE